MIWIKLLTSKHAKLALLVLSALALVTGLYQCGKVTTRTEIQAVAGAASTKTLTKVREVDGKVSAKAQATRAKRAAEHRAQGSAVDTAKRAAPEWASTTLPPEVLGAIGEAK